jgi:hypothetical protein
MAIVSKTSNKYANYSKICTVFKKNIGLNGYKAADGPATAGSAPPAGKLFKRVGNGWEGAQGIFAPSRPEARFSHKIFFHFKKTPARKSVRFLN